MQFFPIERILNNCIGFDHMLMFLTNFRNHRKTKRSWIEWTRDSDKVQLIRREMPWVGTDSYLSVFTNFKFLCICLPHFSGFSKYYESVYALFYQPTKLIFEKSSPLSVFVEMSSKNDHRVIFLFIFIFVWALRNLNDVAVAQFSKLFRN